MLKENGRMSTGGAVVLALASMATLYGCASTARLYPANDEASHIGMLQAKYVQYGTGGGEVTIRMPDGELLQGEYSTIDTNTQSFGGVYATVYGTGGSASAFGTGTSTTIAGSSPGVVSLYGDKGTSMMCEYFVNNWTGKGAGACKASTGALFRMHF